ncbi:Serine proteinase stubble [Melipona quadrifasciata]|uniref:Serine proteinase stubble n=1 Tax=Melipona quadrifasciata TaxID=166423 RepID=A0A0N0BI30_9HYME|nr:Serine proteinase stubble [Melipona quadrifasciata]
MVSTVSRSTVITISGTIEANPKSKSTAFESSFEEIQQEEEDDNAVIIDAASDTDVRFKARDGRGILWNGISNSDSCLTSKGEVGRCTSFKECYPYFKIPDLSALDGWVLGVYDTCSYVQDNGQMNFGICCSNILPVVTPLPDNTEDPIIENTQTINAYANSYFYKTKKELETKETGNQILFYSLNSNEYWQSNTQNILLRPNFSPRSLRKISQEESVDKKEDNTTVKPRPQEPGSWPPPIPTHPPDHTIPPLPTHPSIPLSTFSTIKPVSTSKKPGVSTTWPTKKPARWPLIVSTTSEKPLNILSNTDTSQCGAKNGIQDQERIVGGQNAVLGEWPWIAALFNGGRQFCGGSLIDDRHILTAAHCVAKKFANLRSSRSCFDNLPLQQITLQREPKIYFIDNMNSWDVARLTVRLGDYNIKTNTEITHIERRVRRVVRHRGFNSRTLYNDIALLTLSEPVPFTQQIRPICLPSGSQLYAGKTGTVIGWGSLRESGPQPAILQKVSIPIWYNSECRQKYGAAAPGGIVDSFLCAGRAAKDSCSGDSGGPLMVNDGRWTQVGIVSWGIGCGKGQYPGVYTRVTHFLPWIHKNLKSNSS